RFGGGDALFDAAYLEIVIVDRGAGQEGSRREGGDNLLKIEWHLFRLQLVLARDQRHVAMAGPALDVPLEIGRKATEAAVRHQRLDAGVEGGGEHGVVSAQ